MKRKIHYQLYRRNSICVVFVHGLGGDMSVWDFYIKDILAKGHSVLNLDLRGHGLSCRINKRVRLSDFAKDLKQILNKEKVDKLVLIGHCFGGMVGLEFCLLYPKMVKKLILICSGSKVGFLGSVSKPFLSLLSLIRIKPKFEHVDFWQFKNTGDLNIKRLYSDITHVGIRSYIFILKAILGWNRQSSLDQIKIPVFVIAGRKDIIFPSKAQKELAKKLSNSNLIFIESNHIAVINADKKIKKLILQNL